MERAAKLAEEARLCLYEDKWDFPRHSTQEERWADTRAHLTRYALALGFSPNEISAAIDEAIAAASTPTGEGGK